MTDVFVLMQLPNAGDDLQAIKKGIVELADIIVYNKIDLDPAAADLAMGQMKSALTLLRPARGELAPPVLGVERAAQREGIDAFWREVDALPRRAREVGRSSPTSAGGRRSPGRGR